MAEVDAIVHFGETGSDDVAGQAEKVGQSFTDQFFKITAAARVLKTIAGPAFRELYEHGVKNNQGFKDLSRNVEQYGARLANAVANSETLTQAFRWTSEALDSIAAVIKPLMLSLGSLGQELGRVAADIVSVITAPIRFLAEIPAKVAGFLELPPKLQMALQGMADLVDEITLAPARTLEAASRGLVEVVAAVEKAKPALQSVIDLSGLEGAVEEGLANQRDDAFAEWSDQVDMEVAAYERKLAADNKLAMQNNKNNEAERKSMQSMQESAVAMGVAFGAAFGELTNGSRTASENLIAFADRGIQVVLSAMEQVVIAEAVKAAAGAASGMFSIPIIGPALAAAAATAAFAAVKGLLSLAMKPKGLALGGLVTGGVDGYDSVPATLRRGEVVYTPGQARIADAALAGAGFGGNHTVVINALSIPNRAQARRQMRDAYKDMGRLSDLRLRY